MASMHAPHCPTIASMAQELPGVTSGTLGRLSRGLRPERSPVSTQRAGRADSYTDRVPTVNPSVSRHFLAGIASPGSQLRCVLFHNIAKAESPFTRGLDVTVSPEAFERRIHLFRRHYDLVSLSEALNLAESPPTRGHRPLLVTFDDAYASVLHVAAPVLGRERVPAVLFANAAAIVDDYVMTDNLIAYALNTEGPGVVSRASETVRPGTGVQLGSPATIISSFLSTLSQAEVRSFRTALLSTLATDPLAEARRQGLYLQRDELRSLGDFGVVIANHTYSHAWGRSLNAQDCAREVVENTAVLTSLADNVVRAFSIPYGQSRDVTPVVRRTAQESGHHAVFVVEARPNRSPLNPDRIYRVSMRETSDWRCYFDLEVAPQLRAVRDRIPARASRRAT